VVVEAAGTVVGAVVVTGPGEASAGGGAVVDVGGVVAGDEVVEPAPPDAASAAAGPRGPLVGRVLGGATTVVGAPRGLIGTRSRVRPGAEMDGDGRRPPAPVPRTGREGADSAATRAISASDTASTPHQRGRFDAPRWARAAGVVPPVPTATR